MLCNSTSKLVLHMPFAGRNNNSDTKQIYRRTSNRIETGDNSTPPEGSLQTRDLRMTESMLSIQYVTLNLPRLTHTDKSILVW